MQPSSLRLGTGNCNKLMELGRGSFEPDMATPIQTDGVGKGEFWARHGHPYPFVPPLSTKDLTIFSHLEYAKDWLQLNDCYVTKFKQVGEILAKSKTQPTLSLAKLRILWQQIGPCTISTLRHLCDNFYYNHHPFSEMTKNHFTLLTRNPNSNPAI